MSYVKDSSRWTGLFLGLYVHLEDESYSHATICPKDFRMRTYDIPSLGYIIYYFYDLLFLSFTLPSSEASGRKRERIRKSICQIQCSKFKDFRTRTWEGATPYPTDLPFNRLTDYTSFTLLLLDHFLGQEEEERRKRLTFTFPFVHHQSLNRSRLMVNERKH